MVASLFEHETIATTIQKAKEVKPFAEKLITLAKKGTLHARRRAIALLGNRDVVEYEDGKPVRKGTVIGKLFSELGPRYLDRPGGYTRIIRRSLRRLGDDGQLALLQLIGEGEGSKKQVKAAAKKRSHRRTKAKEALKADKAAESQDIAKESAEVEQVPQTEETPNVGKPDQANEAPQAKQPDGSDGKE
jgi:large subunit ribosomal protein L17